MTKQELDTMIDNGVSAKIHKLLGVWSCNFYPFEEDTLPTDDDGEYDIEQIVKERNSTVYRGIRFYFDTPEQLKVFCETLEQKDNK